MNLLTKNISELKKQFGLEKIKNLKKEFRYIQTGYEDALLDEYLDNWIFLDILYRISGRFARPEYAAFFAARPELTQESILYSLYYWNHLLTERAEKLSCPCCIDDGCQFWIIEQIDHLESTIDCELLEKIENNQI